MWAIGLILYQMASGKEPYDTGCLKEDIDKWVDDCCYHIPGNEHGKVTDLLKLIFKKDPKDRCTIDDIIKKKELLRTEVEEYIESDYFTAAFYKCRAKRLVMNEETRKC